MKNWNYINGAQVGNRTSSEIEKEIAEVESSIDSYYRAGENPPKNLEDRLKRLKAELANTKTGNSTEKLFEGLAKDVEEKEEEKTESIEELEKVGNSLYAELNKPDGKRVVIQDDGSWYIYDHGDNILQQGHESTADSALGKFKAKGYNKKTGNYKTGTSKLKPGDKVKSYGVEGVVKSIKGENEDNIYGEPLIEVEFNSGVKKVVPEHYLVKVGNMVVKTIGDLEIDIDKRPGEKGFRWYVDHKNGNNLDSGFANSKEEAIREAEEKIKRGDFRSPIGNSTTDEYNAEIQRLTQKAEQLRRMGQGKQAMEVEKQIEKLGKELHEYTKTGNSDNMKSYKEVLEKAKQELERIKQKEKEADSYAKKQELASARRDVEDKIKYYQSHIGNSASDEKFAYVMREFDEGKLKTPDGKVVTDPQQAKAIAYSESKKTENGLARARNAMACNKEITLWSGNDSALVKSDGTVLYLESNSFETGRDKFDSQELAVKELAKNGYKPK